MNRRHFLGQVLLGSAAVASHLRAPVHAKASGGLKLKFVGMMGFVERSDHSLLVSLPGNHRFGHVVHVPFMMARAGSRIASELGLTRMPGVIGTAFDYELAGASTAPFVFRCLDHTDLSIISAGHPVAVDNRATHLAQMHRIAPGKRLRANIRQSSHAAISLQGGRLVNASAHPDAGRVWSFGSYQQPLTDAVSYYSSDAKVRLESGTEARTFAVSEREFEELWIVSAAASRSDVPDPKRLEHGGVLFDYFEDATPITATCAEAEGWATTPSELPCSSGAVASLAGGVAREYPPFVDLCYGGFFGDAR